MTPPAVSIVIPTFNRLSFLREALESALCQTFADFEVLVVDDGSTDGTRELCASYPTIRYFRKDNGGPASAYNLGVSLMKGTWFKPLADDDLLEPRGLEVLVDHAKKTDAGVVYGNYIEFGGGRNEKLVSDEPFSKKRLWRHFIGSWATALISKNALDRVGAFREDARWGTDYEWWLRAAFLHGVTFRKVPSTVPLGRYRLHAAQISRAAFDPYVERAKMRAMITASEQPRLLEVVRRIPKAERAWIVFSRMFPDAADSLFWGAYHP